MIVRSAAMQPSGRSCLARRDRPAPLSVTVGPDKAGAGVGADGCLYGNQLAGFTRILGSMRPKPELISMAVSRPSAGGAAKHLKELPSRPGTGHHFPLKTLIFHRSPRHVIFVTNALVQRMPICYMQRAGQVSALPRAVVAELVDAQR